MDFYEKNRAGLLGTEPDPFMKGEDSVSGGFDDPFNTLAKQQRDNNNTGINNTSFHTSSLFDDPQKGAQQPKVNEAKSGTWGQPDWTVQNMNNANTDQPGHNAAVIAFNKLENSHHEDALTKRAEEIDTRLYLKPVGETKTESVTPNWGGPIRENNSHAFQAVKSGISKLEEERQRYERLSRVGEILDTQAQEGRQQNEAATGAARYQNRLQAGANAGIESWQLLRNMGELYGLDEVQVANLLALDLAQGTLTSLPAKGIDVIPNTVNYVSQSFGGEKIIGEMVDAAKNVKEVGDAIRNHNPRFTNADGTRTSLGAVTEIAGKGISQLPNAAFLTMASTAWGAEIVAASALPVEIYSAYMNEYQKMMDQLNEMPGHLIAADKEIMRQFNWNRQFTGNDNDALWQAKNEVAKRRASLSAGVTMVTGLLGHGLSQAVPESARKPSVEFGQNLSLGVLGEMAAQYIMQAAENGNIVHEGDIAW